MSDWLTKAACRGMSPGLFYPTRGDERGLNYALSICAQCSVRVECLTAGYGIDYDTKVGVRGGTLPNERRNRRKAFALARNGRPDWTPTQCMACGGALAQPLVGRKRRFCDQACRRRWWQ